MILPGKLVIDASVVVKWYMTEPGTSEAHALLEREGAMVAPDLLAAEFGNVVWKKVRRGELQGDEAQVIVAAFGSGSALDLLPARPFLASAIELAVQWDCSVYDGLYLSVALAERCPLVTADERFAKRFRGTALGETVVTLGQTA